MKIHVEIDEKELGDLYLQHFADGGNVQGWVEELVSEVIFSHPDLRTCRDENCAELLYPEFRTRQVFQEGFKEYRVDVVAPVETCPRCGSATVPWSEIRREQGDAGDSLCSIPKYGSIVVSWSKGPGA